MGAPQLIGPALTETSQQYGAILTVNVTSSGAGYSAFTTYPDVPAVGGSGTGATFNIGFGTGSALSVASIGNPGLNYVVGDVLTFPSITPGAGLSVTVTSVNDRTTIASDLTVTGRLAAASPLWFATPNNFGEAASITRKSEFVAPRLPRGATGTYTSGSGLVSFVTTTVDNPGGSVDALPTRSVYGRAQHDKINFTGTGSNPGYVGDWLVAACASPAAGGPPGMQSALALLYNLVSDDWQNTNGGIRLDNHQSVAQAYGSPNIAPGELFRIQHYSPSTYIGATNAPFTTNFVHDYRSFMTVTGNAHVIRQHACLNMERFSLSNGATVQHSVPINIQEERAFASNYIRPKTYFGKARVFPHAPATPASVEIEALNTIFSGTITNAGTGYTSGSYFAVALTGGSGTGATANIVVTAGAVTSVTIVSSGVGYAAGNTLSCASIGPGVNFVWTVNSIQSDGSVRLNSTSAVFDASNSSTNGVRFFNRAGTGQTSNTLNWYEEGTYTPTQVGYTLGACTATWTRIGRKVFVTLNFAAGTNNGSAGAASIGLPAGLAPVRSGLGLRAQPTGAASGNGLVAVNAATGNIEISTAVSLDTNAKVIQVEYEV